MADPPLLRVYEKTTCTTCRKKELGLKDSTWTDESIVEAMVRHPELIQRPIVERGERAVLGRPVEKVLEIL